MRASSVFFSLATLATFAAVPACGSNSGDTASDEADIAACAAGQADCSLDADRAKKDAGVDAGKDAGTDAGKDSGGATTDSGTPLDAGPFSSHIRLLEGNISSGNNQSYDPGEGQRILEGMKPGAGIAATSRPSPTSVAAFNDSYN